LLEAGRRPQGLFTAMSASATHTIPTSKQRVRHRLAPLPGHGTGPNGTTTTSAALTPPTNQPTPAADLTPKPVVTAATTPHVTNGPTVTETTTPPARLLSALPRSLDGILIGGAGVQTGVDTNYVAPGTRTTSYPQTSNFLGRQVNTGGTLRTAPILMFQSSDDMSSSLDLLGLA
jgi:hypothetical protein